MGFAVCARAGQRSKGFRILIYCRARGVGLDVLAANPQIRKVSQHLPVTVGVGSSGSFGCWRVPATHIVRPRHAWERVVRSACRLNRAAVISVPAETQRLRRRD